MKSDRFGKGDVVTRDDVAKLAGVSPSVVSYVINNSNYVSAEKRKRVEEAIAQLNYTPNIYARSLRSGSSKQIALIGDSLDDRLFRQMSEKLHDRGYYASLYYSVVEDAAVERLIAMRYDAVFLTSNGFSTAQINRVAAAGIPVVLYKSREFGEFDPKIAIVTPDIRSSIKSDVDYLAMRGHKRMAYVPPLKYRTKGIDSDDYRTKAFKTALEAHGIDPMTAGYCIHTQTVESLCGDVFDLLTGRGMGERPTALIVSEDYIAAHMVRYVMKLGLRVPEDIAIIGWGDTALAEMVTPQLTSVHYDVNAYTDAVIEALMDLIAGKTVEETLLPMRLIVRETT